jgi:hypothetical protein
MELVVESHWRISPKHPTLKMRRRICVQLPPLAAAAGQRKLHLSPHPQHKEEALIPGTHL